MFYIHHIAEHALIVDLSSLCFDDPLVMVVTTSESWRTHRGIHAPVTPYVCIGRLGVESAVDEGEEGDGELCCHTIECGSHGLWL